MDVSHIFNDLNDAQREAVGAGPGPMMILAGAGSGKTRVLTNRLAWLVQGYQVSPLSILAVTFTNKAAREMRGRAEKLLGVPLNAMMIGTFHGLCHRILRHHSQEAGLPNTFEIIDSDDQFRLIKRMIKELDLDEAYWPPKQMQWAINAHKEEGRRPKDIPQSADHHQQTLIAIYERYEATCQRSGLVDFAEILLRTLELFKNNESLRHEYQNRYQYILVDEFQDTNAIQYEWIRILSEPTNNLFAVGDDDQSIYGWRGARVENILNFDTDYPTAKLIRLEQNYRSTSTILSAANAVIDHNAGRMGKELWTAGEDGEPITLYGASNDYDEARYIVEQIENWLTAGNARDSVAILYRSNAQSRVLEERLLNAGIPYRVYGGLRFFERAEIKDALGYMRLVSNAHSDAAFERIINQPTRGIGTKTLDVIRAHARDHAQSMWTSTLAVLEQDVLPARAATAVQKFIDLIISLNKETDGIELHEQTDAILFRTGLLDHYKSAKGEKAEARVENLEELVNATRHFELDEEEELDPLTSFIAHAALEAGEGQADEWEECVQLMSLHSAKGLEFPLVFLSGLEEGLFPHQRSIDEPGRLEEERRLAYVGMTRAMERLVITYAEIRRLHGREHYTQPSRFIREVPPQYINEERSYRIHSNDNSRYSFEAKWPSSTGSSSEISLGGRVKHGTFGEGTVISIDGQGEQARVQVNFDDVGAKWLVAAFANLQAA
ncbi:MAG: DNA helicase-2/ATP-dependent DNA helicase PcrA [Saprospiraceae bacterium]|jgi:DNA helicase-2/ATP-dependent DNA helicase PcrA